MSFINSATRVERQCIINYTVSDVRLAKFRLMPTAKRLAELSTLVLLDGLLPSDSGNLDKMLTLSSVQ